MTRQDKSKYLAKDELTHRPSDGCTFLQNRFVATENIVVITVVFVIGVVVITIVVIVAVCLLLSKLKLPSPVK